MYPIGDQAWMRLDGSEFGCWRLEAGVWRLEVGAGRSKGEDEDNDQGLSLDWKVKL